MSDYDADFEQMDDGKSILAEEYVRAEAENRRIRALFLSLFGTNTGVEVLKTIREQVCLVGCSCFDENPVLMARKAGRQEVAYAIDDILRIARMEEEEDANVA